MKRTLISATVGVGLACVVFFTVDLVDQLRRAAYIAELQAQAASDWLEVSDFTIVDGGTINGIFTEPVVSQTIKAKRLLEARIAINSRNVQSGEPVCVGGTITFIIEPNSPIASKRPLSRFAGVDHCDWPAGEYRSRLAWTLTDPETRTVKTFVQDSEVFRVIR